MYFPILTVFLQCGRNFCNMCVSDNLLQTILDLKDDNLLFILLVLQINDAVVFVAAFRICHW